MTLRPKSRIHRRCFLAIATLMLASGMLPMSLTAAEDAPKTTPGKFRVYVGTYTGSSGSKGIYQTVLDLKTGELSPVEVAGEATSPSFLAIHPTEKSLYAVMEISDFAGKRAGGVGAFTIDPKSGKLTKLNEQSSGGGGPCHIVVDHSGKFALVANYGGGSAGTLPIKADGSLAEMGSFVQHVGTSVDKSRQEAPHAHSINVDAANKFAFVADLGLDKVLIYNLAPMTGKLTPNTPAFAAVDAGAGPRHFAFHPSGKFAYVINEMHCTVTAFTYDAPKGELKSFQTITTLPNGFDGKDYSTAEIQVHPSGKFVYGSNRGHHSIAAFSVDSATGKLKAIGNQREGIKTPRNFGIDPTGQFMIVANQDSNDLVVFRIDQSTGLLTPTGHKAAVPMPVCVKFLPIH